jgi:CRP/FNR family transcriptional regulator, cyclic AMP receptor protein
MPIRHLATAGCTSRIPCDPARPRTASEPRLVVATVNHASQLRILALFEDLPPADLARVASLCVIRKYDKQAQIMGEHDLTTDVFFVLAGSVRISSYTQAGREVIFTEMSDGDMFGEFSALDHLPRSATAVALTDCTLARMPAANFFGVLQRHPEISIRMLELLVAKIRKMSERVFEVSALAVRARVRRELLRLAADGTQFANGVVIRPAPTHYEIAARIGSHREAVTREFNRLEAGKVIEVRRRQIRIVDIERLKRADEDD